MTAITEAKRLTGFVGEVKEVTIVTDANCATGFTFDTNVDGTADVEQIFTTRILSAVLQTTTGTDVASPTWSNSTGVVTIPSVSTGVHILTLRGY